MKQLCWRNGLIAYSDDDTDAYSLCVFVHIPVATVDCC